MSLNYDLIKGNQILDIDHSQNLVSRYSLVSPKLKSDLLAIERNDDSRITKDPKIEKFIALVMKRYYRFWFYIRGIPKIAIPMLITGCQRLLQKLYIKSCQTLNGQSLSLAECIACNGDSTSHSGSLDFRYLDLGIIIAGVLILMIIIRRGIAEANLCVKVLKFQVFVRTSWYYWNHILLIGAVGLVCAGLSLMSSVFLAQKNAEGAQIVCLGQTIQLELTDYMDNLLYWIALYLVSVISYWPIVDFMIDLYDTPYKIFIEPEDMFRLNGEMKGEERLFHNLSFIQRKVRLRYLKQEISSIYNDMNKWTPFRLEKVPDELIQVALLRLFSKNKIKPYKKKV